MPGSPSSHRFHAGSRLSRPQAASRLSPEVASSCFAPWLRRRLFLRPRPPAHPPLRPRPRARLALCLATAVSPPHRQVAAAAGLNSAHHAKSPHRTAQGLAAPPGPYSASSPARAPLRHPKQPRRPALAELCRDARLSAGHAAKQPRCLALRWSRSYRDADQIAKRNPTKCPVFLFFSVNGSVHFCGLAEMVGPINFHKDMDFWWQDKWTGCFPVRWHIIKDVPNYTLQHILLQNNENKPVTHSRDTQEVPYIPGISVLKILKDIKVEECLFDDFVRYEEDEARIKQHRWSKLSHNDPDLVPVSLRKSDAFDLQLPKFGGVLIDSTLEIQNMSEKPHDCNGIKQLDPYTYAVEKQVGSEAEKENGCQENHDSWR